MRWTPRQLMLPLVIGMALTGVSLGIIYLLIESENKKDNADRATRTSRSRGLQTVELEVPRQFVPAVIGRGGSMVKSIECSTGARIRFEDDNPEIEQRICIIKGAPESVRMAVAMVNNVVASQPLIETYETSIPQRLYSKVTMKEAINQIQSSTKAKIIIDNSWSRDPDSKRRVIIKGTAEQIALALTQIEDKVSEYIEELDKLVASESSRSPRGKISPKTPAVDSPGDFPVSAPSADDAVLNEGTMEVYVSAVESPSQFWVQVAGSGTLRLDELVEEMTTYYENEENRELHALKNVTIGQTVAAKFLYDKKWYRAEVTSTLENDECEVYFLDYGDHEVVSIDDVLELRTDFLSLRLQAIECSLASVKPRGGEWSTEAIDRFNDLTWVAQWKILVAKVRGFKERARSCGSSRREGSPIPCVDLYDKNDNKDVNIGKQMVAENFAEAEEGAWSAASSTLSLSKNMTTTSAKVLKKSHVVEEIDLTTPKKPTRHVEEIDLVTPAKKTTEECLEMRNGNSTRENGKVTNNGATKMNIAPAGYESDESHSSEEFTLG